jgi:hypothetical protein
MGGDAGRVVLGVRRDGGGGPRVGAVQIPGDGGDVGMTRLLAATSRSQISSSVRHYVDHLAVGASVLACGWFLRACHDFHHGDAKVSADPHQSGQRKTAGKPGKFIEIG